MNPKETCVLVPISLMQAIANYLTTKPFNEVANFVMAIQRCETDAPKPPDASSPAIAEPVA